MGQFLAFILSLMILVSNLSGSLGNINFTNNLSSSFELENKMASCLLTVLRDPSLNFMSNIGIGLETESTFFRRDFMDTIDDLSALKDKVTINFGSGKKRTAYIDGWLNFIDSVKSLELLIKRQRNSTDDISAAGQNYLIILPVHIPNPERMLQPIFELCWKNFILNVNVLVEDRSGTVTLYTYYPFSENGCRNVTPVIHNRFLKGHLEQNKTIFPSKTRNLWQCPLRVIIYSFPPFVVYNQSQISGPNFKMLHGFANVMNFSLDIIRCSGMRGQVYSNGTSTGCIKKLQNGLGDLSITVFTATGHNHFSATSAHYIFNRVLIVKRSRPYSSLEILLFPFDQYTWIAICLLFVGKWTSQLMSRRISFGSVSPSEHFRRFTLTLWLFGIFIVSSSYEGSIFNFLHNRPSKPLPKSLDQAIAKGYTFIVSQPAFHFLTDIPKLRNHLIVFGADDTMALQHFDNVQGKYGFISLKELLYSSINPERHREYIFIPDPIKLQFFGFYMTMFSHLTMDLNTLLGQMIAHGHVYKTYAGISQQATKKLNVGPKSLKFHEVSGPFLLLGILTGISVCVLLLELLSRYSRRLRKILDFLH